MKVSESSGGHVSLAKADLAMNAIYEKVNNRLQNISQLSSHECQLPLPKYQENGIFNSYIGHANNFSTSHDLHSDKQDFQQQPSVVLESIVSFDKSKNFDLIDEGMMIPEEEQYTKTSGEIDLTKEGVEMGATLATPMKNQKMEKLGKVHLTKQMVREREIFLGVKSKLSRFSRAGSKDLGVINHIQDSLASIVGSSTGVAHASKANQGSTTASGNASMQQAWNTTGLLPTTLSQQGQKPNSVKDFEYLKFVNDTFLKDEVLDRFMQKAGEIEIAAGPQNQSRSKSPNKKQPRTPLEKMQVEFQKNPNGMHTCTRFDRFFSKESSPVRKRLSKDAKNGVGLDLDNQDKSDISQQRLSRERRKLQMQSFTNNSRESVTIPSSKRQTIFGQPSNQLQNSSQTRPSDQNGLSFKEKKQSAQTSKNAVTPLAADKTTSHRDRENLASRINKPKTANLMSARHQRCSTTSTNSARGRKEQKNTAEENANECYFKGNANSNSRDRLAQHLPHKDSHQNQQLRKQRSRLNLNNRKGGASGKQHQVENNVSALRGIHEDERRRVVEETEAYAINVRYQQDTREALQQELQHQLNSDQNRFKTFQNGLKSYNISSHLNSHRNQNRNTSKSGQTTIKAKEELNTAVQDLINVSKKYSKVQEEHKTNKANNNQQRILCASPPLKEYARETQINQHDLHRYSANKKNSQIPTPKYGTSGERNIIQNQQAAYYNDFSNSSLNKAQDVYASYDATRFAAVNKTQPKLDIEPHLVTETDAVQQPIMIKNQSSDDQMMNHLKTEQNTTEFDDRVKVVTDKSRISKHEEQLQNRSQCSSLPDLALNAKDNNHRRRNKAGASSPIATTPVTAVTKVIAGRSPNQLMLNQRRSSLESNCSSLKDSNNTSGLRIIDGRMSCGAGMGTEARSIGITEAVDSRTNLSNDKELKRIYQRKMQVIGRDSNGTLLSKHELADLKINQAKQVAKSVMANEKRKLQIMSKLKPVLNNASKESIEDYNQHQDPSTKDLQNSIAIPKIVQKSCNERKVFHKRVRAISPGADLVTIKTSAQHSLPKSGVNGGSGLPEVVIATQAHGNNKQSSLDRMLNRLSHKQQQMNNAVAISAPVGKPHTSVFQQPIATAVEESVSGENYTKGLRHYLGSQQKNRSNHSKGIGSVVVASKQMHLKQSSPAPSAISAAQEILAVSTSVVTQHQIGHNQMLGGVGGKHRANSIYNAVSKTSTSLAASVINHRPSAPNTSKVTINATAMTPAAANELNIYSNIVATRQFSSMQTATLPIKKPHQHTSSIAQSGYASQQQQHQQQLPDNAFSAANATSTAAEDPDSRVSVSRSGAAQRQTLQRAAGSRHGFRNQANVAVYSNKMVIIRSNSRISDSASSSHKKKEHMKGQTIIVKNIMNEEHLRRIEKVQEAYSGEVSHSENQSNRLIIVNKNSGQSSSSKKLFHSVSKEKQLQPTATTDGLNLTNVLIHDKKHQMSPSMSKHDLREGRQNKAANSIQPRIAVSVMNKPQQTWQESMSQHWKTMGRNSLDRVSIPGANAGAAANSPIRNAHQQVVAKKKLNQIKPVMTDSQQPQSRQLVQPSASVAVNSQSANPPPQYKRNKQKSLAVVAKASSLIVNEQMKDQFQREQAIRTSNLGQSEVKRYNSSQIQKSSQPQQKQEQNQRLLGGVTTSATMTSKTGSNKMNQRNKVQLEASIAEQKLLANSKQHKHYLESVNAVNNAQNNNSSPTSHLSNDSASMQHRQLKSMVISSKNGAQKRHVTIHDQEDADNNESTAGGNCQLSQSLISPGNTNLPQKAEVDRTANESVNSSQGTGAFIVEHRPKLRRPSFLDNVLERPHSQIEKLHEEVPSAAIPSIIGALSPLSRQPPHYSYNNASVLASEALRVKANTQLRMISGTGLIQETTNNLLSHQQQQQHQAESDTVESLEEQLQQSSIMAMQTFQIAPEFSTSATGGAATSFKQMMLGYGGSVAGRGSSN